MTGYSKLTFWVRGETGKEMVEFRVGSDNDSGRETTGDVALSKDWTEHSIDLTRLDLTRIGAGFAWVATNDNNPDGLTFYLDDVVYE